MDAKATDTAEAARAPLDAPRAGRSLAGRPSIVGLVVSGVVLGVVMYVVMGLFIARATAPMTYVFAAICGVGGVVSGLFLAREFRSVATEYVAAADRREFLARLDAEARRSKLVLDPPAGSTPTVPAEARVVPASPAHRGKWWDVRVAFEGDLAALTGPRYLVKHLAKRLR
ncbi:MAG: hypothetical protein U1E39_12280 [Planctomycetota bacterium]